MYTRLPYLLETKYQKHMKQQTRVQLSKVSDAKYKKGLKGSHQSITYRTDKHVRGWGRRKNYTGFWWENVGESDYSEGLGIDERIILKCILRKWAGRSWNVFI